MPYRKYAKRSTNGKRRWSSRARSGHRSADYRRRPTPYRSWRTKPGSGALIQSGQQSSTPFARSARATLVFTETGYDLSTVVGGAYQNRQVWRGNSIFDPDSTGVGVQPYYHDIMEDIYQVYRVFASKITIYPRITTTEANSEETKIYLFPYRSTAAPPNNDPSDLTRIAGVKVMSTNKAKLHSQPRTPKLTAYMTTRRMIDVSMSDDSTKAVFGANPSAQWYWQLITDTSDWTAETDIYFDVKIKYYCRFQSLQSVNES